MECMVDRKLLKTSNNQYKTKSLFYEYKEKGGPIPVYTLKEDDFKGYPSAYRVYMDSDTEYEAAQRLLGSWKHWQRLVKAPWFAKIFDSWKEERELREIALGKKALVRAAGDGNINAAKYLADQSKRKAGRPSKSEVNSELQKQIKDSAKIHSIVERMNKIQ